MHITHIDNLSVSLSWQNRMKLSAYTRFILCRLNGMSSLFTVCVCHLTMNIGQCRCVDCISSKRRRQKYTIVSFFYMTQWYKHLTLTANMIKKKHADTHKHSCNGKMSTADKFCSRKKTNSIETQIELQKSHSIW